MFPALPFFLTSPGSAYMAGIEKATGNFIVIMDADMSHHVSLVLVKDHLLTRHSQKQLLNLLKDKLLLVLILLLEPVIMLMVVSLAGT